MRYKLYTWTYENIQAYERTYHKFEITNDNFNEIIPYADLVKETDNFSEVNVECRLTACKNPHGKTLIWDDLYFEWIYD